MGNTWRTDTGQLWLWGKGYFSVWRCWRRWPCNVFTFSLPDGRSSQTVASVCGAHIDADGLFETACAVDVLLGLGAVPQWLSVHWRRPAEELSYQLLFRWCTAQRSGTVRCTLRCSCRRSPAAVGSRPSFFSILRENQPLLCFLDQSSGVSGPCGVLQGWVYWKQSCNLWKGKYVRMLISLCESGQCGGPEIWQTSVSPVRQGWWLWCGKGSVFQSTSLLLVWGQLDGSCSDCCCSLCFLWHWLYDSWFQELFPEKVWKFL